MSLKYEPSSEPLHVFLNPRTLNPNRERNAGRVEGARQRRGGEEPNQPSLPLQQGCYTDARQGKEDVGSHGEAELLYWSTLFPVCKGGRALGP